jgi:hypothetical protein
LTSQRLYKIAHSFALFKGAHYPHDNAVTVTRNDVADLIAGRGTVISLMGGEQVYITVNEQPEEIMLFWCAT